MQTIHGFYYGVLNSVFKPKFRKPRDSLIIIVGFKKMAIILYLTIWFRLIILNQRVEKGWETLILNTQRQMNA
jgi:hypothetical protein